MGNGLKPQILPDAYWKVIIAKDRVIGWIVPNSNDAVKSKLDDYIESIENIERKTGVKIPVPDDWKVTKPERSWQKPGGCDLS